MYRIPAAVEQAVAAMAGPIIAVGSTEPYWLLYTMMVTGIS